MNEPGRQTMKRLRDISQFGESDRHVSVNERGKRMNVELMKKLKKEYGYSNSYLSKHSGVPLGTLQKIFSGETQQPRYETLKALEKVFFGNPKYHDKPYTDSSMLRETAAHYGAAPSEKHQGEYTLEDYYALPEDQRAELIDGVLYDMTSPATRHQLIAGEVHRQISNFIQEHGGQCIPFISPVDVQLDCDDKTMVEPDVAIVCDRDKIIGRCVYGAPDFVLEVLSPSTQRKDCTIKLMKYMNAHVREYWLADPYQNKVLVYFFEDDHCCPGIYPLDAEIPVHIYNGALKICLSRIADWLECSLKEERPR